MAALDRRAKAPDIFVRLIRPGSMERRWGDPDFAKDFDLDSPGSRSISGGWNRLPRRASSGFMDLYSAPLGKDSWLQVGRDPETLEEKLSGYRTALSGALLGLLFLAALAGMALAASY